MNRLFNLLLRNFIHLIIITISLLISTWFMILQKKARKRTRFIPNTDSINTTTMTFNLKKVRKCRLGALEVLGVSIKISLWNNLKKYFMMPKTISLLLLSSQIGLKMI